MSEESLHAEAAQLKASLSTIDDRIDQARRELKAMRGRSDEQDIWETNLVMLQAFPASLQCMKSLCCSVYMQLPVVFGIFYRENRCFIFQNTL